MTWNSKYAFTIVKISPLSSVRQICSYSQLKILVGEEISKWTQ